MAKKCAACEKAKMKKMETGGSLGMKSVKTGFDKNSGVTRADTIIAAKQNADKMKKGGSTGPFDKYKAKKK
jgi:hypothetical protein